MKSVPAITFDYRPSRWLTLAVLSTTAFAVVAVGIAGIGAGLKFALGILIVSYSAFCLRRYRRPAFQHVAWHAAGHWRLRATGVEEQSAQLTHSIVLGALIVVCLRARSPRYFVLCILPDVCDAETRRQLRVRLSRANVVEAQ